MDFFLLLFHYNSNNNKAKLVKLKSVAGQKQNFIIFFRSVMLFSIFNGIWLHPQNGEGDKIKNQTNKDTNLLLNNIYNKTNKVFGFDGNECGRYFLYP